MDLMDSVAQLNQQRQQNIDAYGQLFDNAKVADAMVKANPDLEQRMGMTPGQFSTLSAQDKIAATTGYIKNQGVQEMAARMKDWDAQAGQRQQQVQDDQTAGAFLQNYLTAPETTTDPDGTERPTSPQERLSMAAGKTPGMSGRILPKVMDSLAKWQAVQQKPAPTDNELSTTFSEDPTTGARFANRGKQILPAGYDPDTQKDGPVYSPDGKMFWSGKQWTPLKELGYPEGSTIKTIAGVNAVVGPTGQILKTIGTQSAGQALAEALGTGKGGAAKVVTPDIAKQYLKQAGGDKVKARQLATQDGYTF